MSQVQIEIQKAYLDFLGRGADGAGRAWWANQIAGGMSVERMRTLMASSPEALRSAEREITRFYQTYLGRSPDAGGLAWWMTQFAQGEGLGQIESRMSSSPEGLAYAASRPAPGNPGRGPSETRDPISKPAPPGMMPDPPVPGVDNDDQAQRDAAAAADAAAEEAERAAVASARSAVASLEAAFPFITELGLGVEITAWAREKLGGDAIMGLIRGTTQWKNMFPNLRRADGTLLMNEAQFLQQMDSYREVLKGFGKYDERYDDVSELSGFLAPGVMIDPGELEERLQIYSALERNNDVRNAFYIYAGMRVSTDDLYQAVVDPRYRTNLSNEYNARATMTNLDYDTWITRSTEVALSGLAQKLTEMEAAGVSANDAVTQIRSMDPAIAKEFMQLLHMGTQEGGAFLEDDALQIAFENAMLGSAAIAQGLGLPGADRIEEIRAAGVTRAAALQGYGKFAKDQNMLRSMARRAGFGGLSQDQFEKASFLSDADSTRQMEKGQGMEDAIGRGTQGSSFSNQGGEIRQMGLRA